MIRLFAFLVMTVLLAIPLTAQKTIGKEAAGQKKERKFNPETIESVTGEIQKILQISTRKNMAFGTHIIIKTHQEKLPVHIGPSWYLKELEIDFEKGDLVEIKGSRIEFEGQPTIIAMVLKKEGKEFVLRDQNGLPHWRGMGKKKMGGGNGHYKSRT
ncbi:hypothetical protein FGF1_20930 [Flavobacteriaceae bacterium GF1]